MTNFERLKSMNEKEMSEFLDSIISVDDDLWIDWFNKKYCENCEIIEHSNPDGGIPFTYTYCEINGNCRYFQDKDDIPNSKEMIELWLKERNA